MCFLQIFKMPEQRDSGRTAVANLSGGGFFIRRVTLPGVLVLRGTVKPLTRRVLSPSSNKEKAPPVWAVRAAPNRRSPLPDWYPRTPLRDITAIVKAIERKSRSRDAAARQQSQRSEQSLQSMDLTPAQAEQASLAVAPGSSSTQIVASPALGLAEGELKVPSSPPDSAMQTPSKPTDPALADLLEKKLYSSIEQIEKMVRRNLKRTQNAAQPSKRATQRRTLMSMR